MRISPFILLIPVALVSNPQLRAQNSPAPPGRLVDIGGQRIHVNCTGRGTPTVLLENGTGDFSMVWALVQPTVSRLTRVCSYDRGGSAWSEMGQRPRTFAQLSLELHTALDRLHEKPPYVLVGQSYGGVLVRGFAAAYSKDVAGMVLVDAVHEDQHIVYGGAPHLIRAEARGRPYPAPHIALDTAWTRMYRDSIAASAEPLEAPLDRLPPEARRLWQWAAALPSSRHAPGAELDWSPEEFARFHQERLTDRATLGNLLLIVLARTSGEFDNGLAISADSLERERRALMADLAALSHRGEVRYAPHSGHNIHLEDPDFVVTAIRDVVGKTRAGPL